MSGLEHGVYEGTIGGVFYSWQDPVAAGGDFLKRVDPWRWKGSSTEGARREIARAWCQGSLPYEGDLEADSAGYEDYGSGLWRGYIREDIRSAGKIEVQGIADRIARADHGRPWSALPPDLRRDVRDQAREIAIAEATPRARIAQAIFVNRAGEESWAWVSRTGGGLATFAARAVGPLSPEALAWTDQEVLEGHGFSWRAEGAVRTLLRTGSVRIDADVRLTSIRFESSTVKAASFDPERDLDGLRSWLSAERGATVTRLELEVEDPGKKTRVVIDGNGFSRAVPPASIGGLDHERILRRLGDAKNAVRRASEALADAAKKIEGEE